MNSFVFCVLRKKAVIKDTDKSTLNVIKNFGFQYAMSYINAYHR